MNAPVPRDEHAGEAVHTPLHDLHLELGARMVSYAGSALPLQYPSGIISEHLHTRTAAGLFDVSHMGQARLVGDPAVAALMERLVPADIAGLGPGQMRYTQLLNGDGGIIDDLMVTRPEGRSGEEALFLVVNGACKLDDFAHIEKAVGAEVDLEPWPRRALIALQGPRSAEVLAELAPEAADMPFMTARSVLVEGSEAILSRCGYTGEDGFEISIDAGAAETVARRLLAHDAVAPVGLGARDSLRLEAGLCLYGNDIDATTSPVEAGLGWSIGRRRREEGGFPGAERILAELDTGPARKLVGIRLQGRAPARQGTEIHSGGRCIGTVTSGLYGATVGAPVAMGYVETDHARPGTQIDLMVRGRPLPAETVSLPFVPHRYHRKPNG